MHRLAVGLRQAHREIDGGMIGYVEEEDLRGADQERGLDPRRLLRRAVIEKDPDQMAQRAQPAQHRGGESPHQRAVALGQAGKSRMRGGAVEHFVERAPAAQHVLDDVGGNLPGRQARYGVGIARLTRGRFSLGLHPAFLAWFAGTGEGLAAGRTLRHVNIMASEQKSSTPAASAADRTGGKRPLPLAERALAEAAARRAERGRTAPDQPKEIGGRDGPEPTRYGDWEVNGLTSDF